jgi:hypothetical protein
LLDFLPLEVLSPSLRREVSPSDGPTGETAAKVQSIATFESGETAKRESIPVFESEDAPAAKRAHVRESGETAKAKQIPLFESENSPAAGSFEDEPDPVEEEFQRQLAELRKANARVYANPTPWPVKK